MEKNKKFTRGKWPRPPIEERLFSNVEIDAKGCWVWTGPVTQSGYGKLILKDVTNVAHRISYLMFVGNIPTGLQLDHLCRNRLCVKPNHLEAVTPRENVMRGIAGDILRRRHHAITHCPQGHAYDEKNTYRWKTSRVCIACRNARVRAYKKAHPEKRREQHRAYVARRKIRESLIAGRTVVPKNLPTQNQSSTST